MSRPQVLAREARGCLLDEWCVFPFLDVGAPIDPTDDHVAMLLEVADADGRAVTDRSASNFAKSFRRDVHQDARVAPRAEKNRFGSPRRRTATGLWTAPR